MKVTKWWKNNRVLEKNRKLRYWNIILWIGTWIRVNVFTIKKRYKELKIACSLGNLSYRKFKKGCFNE